MKRGPSLQTARLLLTLVSALGAGCSSGTGAGVSTQSREVEVIVEATQLASAFEESDERAAGLYGGKRARILGHFAKAEPHADGNTAMTFKTSMDTFRPVRCVFDPISSAALNRLREGDEVAIKGNIVGFRDSRYFVTVEDCVLQ